MYCRPTATEVKPLPDHRLQILFDSGEQKIFDVTPYLRGSFMGKLADEDYFAQVTTDGYTVVWPNGQDLCPDELYELSI